MSVAVAAVWPVCRGYDARYPSWEEEVQLSDNRIIAVKQRHGTTRTMGPISLG